MDVRALDPEELTAQKEGERSADVRERVQRARTLQQERFAATATSCNARMRGDDLKAWADPGEDGNKLLRAATLRLGLSARGYDRVRRVARTIADLAGEGHVGAEHVAEALQYRAPASSSAMDLRLPRPC